MKEGLSIQEVGDWAHVVEKNMDVNSAYNTFKVSLDSNEIESAKQALKLAKSSGAFK